MRARTALMAGCAAVTFALTAGCASGPLAAPTSAGSGFSAVGDPAVATSAAEPAGPRLTVTVPPLDPPGDPSSPSSPPLPPPSSPPPSSPADPVSASDPVPSELELTDAASAEAEPSAAPSESTPFPVRAGAESPAQAPPAAPAEGSAPTSEPPAEQRPAPAGPALPPVTTLDLALAQCEGCTVIASYQSTGGGFSAAEVQSAGGRVVLLSIRPDGQVASVINVVYGASFPAPSAGALACDGARCIVIGRLGDGRAILSAFEITGSGAWRDVSGDDAFPSATEAGAAVDLGGQLGIAVQDGGESGAGTTVWLVYRWDASADRFVPLGCAPAGAAPPPADALTVESCLS